MSTTETPIPRNRRKWVARGILAGTGLVSFSVAFLVGPGADAPYLALQAQSDQVHRFAVMALPVSGATFLFFWPIGVVFSEFFWVRWITRCVMALSLMCAGSIAGYVWKFDRTIESNGLRGQMILTAHPAPPPGEHRETSGPFLEDESGPGVASATLPSGDHMTLDRRTLARRTPDGGYRWSRSRPGRWPGSLLVTPLVVFTAMPGPDFEDDVVVTTVDLESGRKHFDYHCLGNKISPVTVQGAFLAFAAKRPSLSSVHLLRWSPPALVWSRSLPGEIALAPRLTADSVDIASGVELIRLSRSDGTIQDRKNACADPRSFRVVCERNRVVAWE